jgi:hypothetical protein
MVEFIIITCIAFTLFRTNMDMDPDLMRALAESDGDIEIPAASTQYDDNGYAAAIAESLRHAAIEESAEADYQRVLQESLETYRASHPPSAPPASLAAPPAPPAQPASLATPAPLASLAAPPASLAAPPASLAPLSPPAPLASLAASPAPTVQPASLATPAQSVPVEDGQSQSAHRQYVGTRGLDTDAQHGESESG